MTTDPPSNPVWANKLTPFKTIELDGKLFPDQTGKFPIISSKGSKYVMVMFVKDANAILAKTMKSRSEQETTNEMIKLHTYLTNRRFPPRIQILDN